MQLPERVLTRSLSLTQVAVELSVLHPGNYGQHIPGTYSSCWLPH